MEENILRGEVCYLYAFDVADEIRTAGITSILSTEATPLQIQIDKNLPKSFHYYRPLTIASSLRSWKIGGTPLQTLVRVYDVGVVSIVVFRPFQGESLKSLIPMHHPVLESGQSLDEAALELCREILKNLSQYLVRGVPKLEVPEAYTVFCLYGIEGVDATEPWISSRRAEVAGLLSETDPAWLSAEQVEETFRHRVQFDRDDLTVVDWDAALAINLAGRVDDEIHVLELANLQLEELVLMDKRVDNYLDRAYEELEKDRAGLLGFGVKQMRALRRFSVDIAKLTDEVSNISKFFGDWYLARVYLAARERFHIQKWRDSVQSRMAHLDKMYEARRGEIYDARMLLLEILIVLLFIIDLVGVFWLKKG